MTTHETVFANEVVKVVGVPIQPSVVTDSGSLKNRALTGMLLVMAATSFILASFVLSACTAESDGSQDIILLESENSTK